jgi:hypothetical protein
MRRVAAISALAVVAATVSATAASAHEPQPPSAVAFQPGTGDSVAEWNRALLTIVKTAGAQPATMHPTYSYAIMNTAIYDTVVSITHADKPMLVQTRVRRQARPDASADQAADQFRPNPPPSLTTDQWAQAINEVQSLGQDTSTTRTADETLQAKFWAPANWNTWNQIADDQCVDDAAVGHHRDG